MTETEIDIFLSAFEDGSLPKERFNHAAHILTGACYVHRFGEAAAIDRMRSNLRRYNEAVGGQNTDAAGYHETLTIFWIKLLASLLRARAPLSRAAFAALATQTYIAECDVFRAFYDFDLVASTEARRAWIPPTLKPLP